MTPLRGINSENPIFLGNSSNARRVSHKMDLMLLCVISHQSSHCMSAAIVYFRFNLERELKLNRFERTKKSGK